MRPSLQSDLPLDRLKKVLIKVAFADHIRQIQTAYRDSSDCQILAKSCRKFLFDKTENTDEEVVVSSKTLIEIIVDGRARALALATLCYGDESLEKGKCLLDYANACALQGSWEIAQERIRKAAEIFSPRYIPKHKEVMNSKRVSAIFSAQVVRVIFSVLREHSARNAGKVRESFITELMGVLGRFFPKDESSSNVGGESSGYVTRIATALAKFFAHSSSGARSDVQEKTWILMVHFLRCKSEEIKMLFDAVEGFLLPQHVALLDMPFHICDHKERGVAHPVELARELNSFPSVIKLLSGGVKLAQQLHEMVDKAPIALSKLPSQAEGDGVFLTRAVGREEQGVRLFHDLPLTREEYLSCFLLESDAAASAVASASSTQENEKISNDGAVADYYIDVIKIQVLSLQGVCGIYTDHLPLAEECFQSALSLLSQWSLEMDMVACELYNSIAQMMIMKHKQAMVSRQKQLRKQCEEWLHSEEAVSLIKQQCKVIKKETDTTAKPVSKGDIENRARSIVYKQRMQYLDGNADASLGALAPQQSLEAAYRYLLKSFDISETIYGPFHPMVGTACLAVASVQNLGGKLADTKEWLEKSLKSFEKSKSEESGLPIPVRAITFTQTQLAQVLQKLGQVDEAMAALMQAVSFHMQEAKHGLLLHKTTNTNQNTSGEGVGEEYEGLAHLAVPAPLLKSSALQSEIDLTLELSAKALKLAAVLNSDDGAGAGAGWRGVQLAQEMALISEEAYGWDSVEAATAYKQVGTRCVSLCDWNRAVKYLKMSVESHVVAYGQKDIKTIQVLRALADARKNRAASRRLTAEDDRSDGERERSRSRSRERSSINYDKDAASSAKSTSAAGRGQKTNPPPSGRSSSASRSHYRSVKSMQTRMKTKKVTENNNLLESFEVSSPPVPKMNTLIDLRRGAQSKTIALEDEIVFGNEHDFNDFIKKGIFKSDDNSGNYIAPPKGAYEEFKDGDNNGEDEEDDSYGDDPFPVSPLSNSMSNSPEANGRKSKGLIVEVEEDDV